jgi:hypothetical protein
VRSERLFSMRTPVSEGPYAGISGVPKFAKSKRLPAHQSGGEHDRHDARYDHRGIDRHHRRNREHRGASTTTQGNGTITVANGGNLGVWATGAGLFTRPIALAGGAIVEQGQTTTPSTLNSGIVLTSNSTINTGSGGTGAVFVTLAGGPGRERRSIRNHQDREQRA